MQDIEEFPPILQVITYKYACDDMRKQVQIIADTQVLANLERKLQGITDLIARLTTFHVNRRLNIKESQKSRKDYYKTIFDPVEYKRSQY